MNFKTFYLVAMLALSCSGPTLSENETYTIQKAIDIHNITARYQFTKDSLNGMADRWSAPYDINKDRNLTMDKYLKYCKAHNYDPKEYAKILSQSGSTAPLPATTP